jgi:hypothetical protein
MGKGINRILDPDWCQNADPDPEGIERAKMSSGCGSRSSL